MSASAVPFAATVAVEVNPFPVIVIVTAPEPIRMLAGEIPLTAGTGCVTVRFPGKLVPPAGVRLTTLMVSVPADARFEAERLSWSEVALT